MKFAIYDYVDSNGVNQFKKWAEGLEKDQRGKLLQKIHSLSLQGEDLYPSMLTDSGLPGIKKLRVQGPVKLRPLLCRGPVDNSAEYTLLLGAKEVGSKWVPKEAPSIANENKKAVTADAVGRRIKHERLSK